MLLSAVAQLETLLDTDPVLGTLVMQAVASREKHEVAERRGDATLRPRLLRKQVWEVIGRGRD